MQIRNYAVHFLALAVFLGSCNANRHAVASPKKGDDAALKKKYAGMMGVDEKNITDIPLYKFIDEWYGAPYKYGGRSKSGVDCSDFASLLFENVYQKKISGSCAMLYTQCEVIPKDKLKEGDLVFFKINSDKISHVGVYLQNGHFVHASVHKGVMIDDLSEAYYTKYFFKGGRMK